MCNLKLFLCDCKMETIGKTLKKSVMCAFHVTTSYLYNNKEINDASRIMLDELENYSGFSFTF